MPAIFGHHDLITPQCYHFLSNSSFTNKQIQPTRFKGGSAIGKDSATSQFEREHQYNPRYFWYSPLAM